MPETGLAVRSSTIFNAPALGISSVQVFLRKPKCQYQVTRRGQLLTARTSLKKTILKSLAMRWKRTEIEAWARYQQSWLILRASQETAVSYVPEKEMPEGGLEPPRD